MKRNLTVGDANVLLREFESPPLSLVGAYSVLGSECFLFDRIGCKATATDMVYEAIVEANCAWKIVMESSVLVGSTDMPSDYSHDLVGEDSADYDDAVRRLLVDGQDGLWQRGNAAITRAMIRECNSLVLSFVNGAELILMPRDPINDNWVILRSGKSQILLWKGSLAEISNLE